MEGPGVLHLAWLLCLAFIWVYHRYFAIIAPRSEPFEAFCRARPVVARIAVSPGSEAELARHLSESLGPRAEAIPTLAGWPWTHHALKLEIATEPGAIQLTIAKCRVLRVQERALPALTDLLLELLAQAPAQAKSCWLHPAAFRDVLGEISADQGWRLVPGRPRTQCVEPWHQPAAKQCA